MLYMNSVHEFKLLFNLLSFIFNSNQHVIVIGRTIPFDHFPEKETGALSVSNHSIPFERIVCKATGVVSLIL